MKLSRIALALAIAGLSAGAHATNGYFSHGYGMKAKGMAGVSTTNTEDAFFGANNPAAAAFAGNRLDLGVDLFSPIRKASRTGSYGSYGSYFNYHGTYDFDGSAKSDSNYFLIPEFGYNKMINPNLALGVTVYGNGGMNTNYPITNTFDPGTNLLGGTGRLGVDLMQLIVAPTVAYKVAPNHAIGISPLIGYQRFKAEGLQGFGVMNGSGGNLGYDDAFGYGVRIGYLGKLTPPSPSARPMPARWKWTSSANTVACSPSAATSTCRRTGTWACPGRRPRPCASPWITSASTTAT